MPLNTFTPPAAAKIKYPRDVWTDSSDVTIFENRSVEVRNDHSVGAWGDLPVTIIATEADADTIFTFLRDQRLRGIPFYFNHRKRGTVLVRYWADELPMTRRVDGSPDLIEFNLPLRAE